MPCRWVPSGRLVVDQRSASTDDREDFELVALEKFAVSAVKFLRTGGAYKSWATSEAVGTGGVEAVREQEFEENEANTTEE